MSDREGTLRMQSSGRWAICRPGCDPFEITSGDVFRVEVDDELKLTRMEYRHFEGPLRGREFRGAPGEYYSVDGYELHQPLSTKCAKSAEQHNNHELRAPRQRTT